MTDTSLKLQRYEEVKNTKLFKKFLAKEKEAQKKSALDNARKKYTPSIYSHIILARTPEKEYPRRMTVEDDADQFEREYDPSYKHDKRSSPYSKPRQEYLNELQCESQYSSKKSSERKNPYERSREPICDQPIEYEQPRIPQGFSYADKELLGVSEQVPYDKLAGIFNTAGYQLNTAGYQPILPLFPYAQPYGNAANYINPMLGVTYPIPSHTSHQANKDMSVNPFYNSLYNSEQGVRLMEEIKRLQNELKEANEKVARLEIEVQSNSSNESKLRELQEKLHRKDMDADITEKMLKSEIEALQHRNEELSKRRQNELSKAEEQNIRTTAELKDYEIEELNREILNLKKVQEQLKQQVTDLKYFF
jgi:hypothetical protein